MGNGDEVFEQLVSSLPCVSYVSGQWQYLTALVLEWSKSAAGENQSRLSWGHKLGPAMPTHRWCKFWECEWITKKKREREREQASGVLCIRCGRIYSRLTGCDQHLKGFLIRHSMSHTSQRPQSIPWIVTKRATPLPSPPSPPPSLLSLVVIFSFMRSVSDCSDSSWCSALQRIVPPPFWYQ